MNSLLPSFPINKIGLALLACGFLGSTSSAAELEQTDAFSDFNRAYRKEIEQVLPKVNFNASWAQVEGGDWTLLLKDKEKKIGGTIEGETFTPLPPQKLKGSFKGSKKDSSLSNGPSQDEEKSKTSFPALQRIDDTTFELVGEKHQAPSGWIWGKRTMVSPNAKWVCLTRTKDVDLQQVSYIRSSPDDQVQPKFFRKTYPKPGDELRTNLPVVLSETQKLELDPALISNPYSVTNFHWRSESKLWAEYIERGFGTYRLLELDTETGKTRIVAEEQSDKFVHVFNKCGWWDLGDNQLLWRSEADGWNHLYLIDAETGERKQLTSGKWVVREVNRIDGDKVYFQLSGYYPEQDPYYLHYACLNVKNGNLTLLTEGDGTHQLSWSPDRSYYVDRYSRVDTPPVYELRKTSNGQLLTQLWRYQNEDELKESPYLPERFVTSDREGRHSIHGVIWKPKNFDPTKSYPIIEQIYAGPHGAFVPKGWRTWYGARHEAAAAGFVVVQIDGRGTNYRGQEFQQYAYKNLRDSGFPDRIKWMQEAAKTRPWMDVDRVGIYGGSAGGQSALAALLWHNHFYKAAAADCGCHDNRMDKIWWNEQWLDWPIGEAYLKNSNTEHASLLKGKLLLTVGELDTNVDPSSTYQVVDALIRADKDFDFLMVPNANHGVGEKSYLRRRRIQFFQRWLGETTAL